MQFYGKGHAVVKTKIKRILITVLTVILLCIIGFAVYFFASYYRVEDMLPLDAEGSAQRTEFPVGTEQKAVTFNIGFGAYEPDFDFFMDGGHESWAFSEERLQKNLSAITDFLREQDADILLLQEVDENGTRSYHVNERTLIGNAMDGYSTVWAQNWDVPFLPYPLYQPHGSNTSGILTFSRTGITSSVRRSLPVEDSLMRLVDLDRCYSVSRIPTENGHELVLYNLHLSAYTSDGTIAVKQLEMILADMTHEYEQGNYVIAGGDFNKDLLGDSEKVFGFSGNNSTWAQPFPMEMLDGMPLHLCAPYDAEAPVPSCRNADSPYHEGQYVLTIDGFLVSDNIDVSYCNVIDTGFIYSDHNPAELYFVLLPD